MQQSDRAAVDCALDLARTLLSGAQGRGPNLPLGAQGPHPSVRLRHAAVDHAAVDGAALDRAVDLARTGGPGEGTQLAPRDPGAPP